VTAAWAHAATFAAIAVLVAGCAGTVRSGAGDPASTTTRKETTKATTEPATAGAETVPLVLETSVPPAPPAVELIAGAGSREVGQRGVVFTADWTTRRSVDVARTYFPVRWPEATTIPNSDSATLALHTSVPPDWVVVKTYPSVASGSRTPDARPIREFECTRFTAPTCDVATTDAGLRIRGLGRGVFAGAYVVVFCTWHVPLADQRAGSLTPGDVVASWLFHFDAPRDREASSR
jgi:hypothetical protein